MGKRINKTEVFKRAELHFKLGHENLNIMLSNALIMRATEVFHL